MRVAAGPVGLTGYGGGVDLKRRLLALEGAWPGALWEGTEMRPDGRGPPFEEEERP